MNARLTPAPTHAALADRLGRPLRDLRISVIDACNFRCPYCMPADKVDEHHGTDAAARLSFDEIERAARGFVRAGVSKLRLTGGEPLLRRNLPDLVARLSSLPGVEDLALTTNGSLLARQARALRAAGLHRLTISLDSLDPARFAAMSGGRGRLDQVLRGIEAAEDAGFRRIKFNVVIRRGTNEDDALAIAGRFRGTSHVVRFIEFMDVGTRNDWRRDEVVPSAELHARLSARWPLVPLDANYRGEVAERHAWADGEGEVGFISSVSTPFCGDCNRARLSAEGRLYTCLFASSGHDMRPWLQGDAQALDERIAAIWSRRADRYSEQRGARARDGARPIEMYLIGG
ncbi:GTP 3',8-cyclase MoaA [Coralloluteibacterium stylophorae]|uniref:GTP 3',8-cyclase n=1 Tax=Coralloluteibacterium stylophorae TaxID=1776034 RepID=A0A8J8AXA2_9GAMM|nr:GTP 3',8-cyclase MoaA [Coralloluteibacterium stylophorae]MBS7457651.1 GTP 3',8-cyclase MoaA [Coralloluteibacterium stylophorae]